MSVTIKIDHAHKCYGSNVIIEDLSVRIREGEFFTLLGPSGCGKTTLLRMIAGFNSIEGGDFYFNDTRINDIDPSKRRIGMVFQNYAIFPHLSVKENVMFGLKNQQRRMAKAEMEAQTQKFMELMHIDEYAERKPERLSGGQQQRVALARTLNQSPSIILADEPVAALDPVTAHQVMSDFRRINEDMNISVLINIHHVDLALKYATRVIGIRAGEVVYDGPTGAVTQEILDSIYNGAAVPQAGE